MASKLEQLIEDGRIKEADEHCERHSAAIAGNPSLEQMIKHATRFNDDRVEDVLLAAWHLSTDEYATLEETVARLIATKRKARFR